MYDEFRADVVRHLRLHRMTYQDLAELTHYSLQSIRLFFSHCERPPSREVAAALSRALDIPIDPVDSGGRIHKEERSETV